MKLPERVTEAQIYAWMHELRLNYATGAFDGNQEAMQYLNAGENGKKFYEVLDEEQMDQLITGLVMGYFSESQIESLKTKFPEIEWSKYTSDGYIVALKAASTQDQSIGKLIGRAGKEDMSHSLWTEVKKIRHDNFPIGQIIYYAVADARGIDL